MAGKATYRAMMEVEETAEVVVRQTPGEIEQVSKPVRPVRPARDPEAEKPTAAILPIYLLLGPAGEAINLTIRDRDGNIRKVELERNSMQRDGSQFMYRFVYDAFVASSVESRFLDEHVLYVKIPNFDREEIVSSFHQLLEEIDLSTTNGTYLVHLRTRDGGTSYLGSFLENFS